MAGRKFVPKTEKEQLLFYKGVYKIRNLIDYRIKKMEELTAIDKEIAKNVVDIRDFMSWRELGEMLKMTEQQANRYLSPLMEEVENDRGREAEA